MKRSVTSRRRVVAVITGLIAVLVLAPVALAAMSNVAASDRVAGDQVVSELEVAVVSRSWRVANPPDVDVGNARSCRAGIAPERMLPVEGAVVIDGFRRPACPWCAGNRGIEFATTEGAPVRSITPGRVTFAGSVAGTLYAVVATPSGRRVSYGGLGHIGVEVGASLEMGTSLGSAGPALHLGVRRGERYEDPEALIASWGPSRLVSLTTGSDPDRSC